MIESAVRPRVGEHRARRQRQSGQHLCKVSLLSPILVAWRLISLIASRCAVTGACLGGAPQSQVLGRDAGESPLLLPGQVLAKSFRLGAQVYGEL